MKAQDVINQGVRLREELARIYGENALTKAASDMEVDISAISRCLNGRVGIGSKMEERFRSVGVDVDYVRRGMRKGNEEVRRDEERSILDFLKTVGILTVTDVRNMYRSSEVGKEVESIVAKNHH